MSWVRVSELGHERTLDIRGKIADNFAISDLVGVSNAAVGNSTAVLPLDAAIAAVDWCATNKIHILGWEGWVQSADGRVGHGNAPQGTTSLDDVSVLDAADFCRQTIRTAALEWTQRYPETTDRLHFCITVAGGDARP